MMHYCCGYCGTQSTSGPAHRADCTRRPLTGVVLDAVRCAHCETPMTQTPMPVWVQAGPEVFSVEHPRALVCSTCAHTMLPVEMRPNIGYIGIRRLPPIGTKSSPEIT